MDRIIGEFDKTDLIVHQPHKVYATGKEETEREIRQDCIGESVYSGSFETEYISCKCGEEFDTIGEAQEHLSENPYSKGSLNRDNIRKNLEDVAIHGFEFGTLEAHGGSIAFYHKDLALTLYATPNYHYQGEVSIQLSGDADTVFENLNGQVVDRVESEELITVEEYLRIVRDWIEENLLNYENQKKYGVMDNNE